MRNPLRKAGYGFVLGLVGVGGILLATSVRPAGRDCRHDSGHRRHLASRAEAGPRLPAAGAGDRLGLAVALAGGVGWIMHSRGDESQTTTTMIVITGSIMTTIGALVCTAIIVLATQPWKR